MKIFIYIYYFFRSVFLRGFVNTIRLLSSEGRYEKKFSIKTAAFKKSDSKEFFHYQGAGYLALLRVFKETFGATIDFDFIDIGCGKGRAVFVAEHCGYNNLTGIELDDALIREAEENQRIYPFKREASHIHFVHANALNYDYKNKPSVYFMFNPFNEDIMRKVLTKIMASTTAETWFIYMNPLYTKPFAEKDIELIKTLKTGRYVEAVIYKVNTR